MSEINQRTKMTQEPIPTPMTDEVMNVPPYDEQIYDIANRSRQLEQQLEVAENALRGIASGQDGYSCWLTASKALRKLMAMRSTVHAEHDWKCPSCLWRGFQLTEKEASEFHDKANSKAGARCKNGSNLEISDVL